MKLTWGDVTNNYDTIYKEKQQLAEQYKTRLNKWLDEYNSKR